MCEAAAKVPLSVSGGESHDETDKYSVEAWVKNLTNRETFGDGLDLRASFGYDYLVPLAPRTFGLSGTVRF